ncbi:MAG: prepilin-type N-terminal cleavage/methylation domain-containing protein [bacterium]
MIKKKDLLRAKSRSFTLIELLVVIFIIGLLATMVVIRVSSVRISGRDARRIADVDSIKSALEMYYEVNGTYPTGTTASWACSGDECEIGTPTYQQDWDYIASGLQPYINTLPLAPVNTAGKKYYLLMYDQYGIIYTKLESNSDKMIHDDCEFYGNTGSNYNFYNVAVGDVTAHGVVCGYGPWW